MYQLKISFVFYKEHLLKKKVLYFVFGEFHCISIIFKTAMQKVNVAKPSYVCLQYVPTFLSKLFSNKHFKTLKNVIEGFFFIILRT